MALEKVVFVVKKTRLEELLETHSTVSQIKFYLESRGESFKNYMDAHEIYKRNSDGIMRSISSKLNRQVVDKSELQMFTADRRSVIVIIGDPGLVANCAKYVGGQPVIALNPDPERYADVFTSCGIDEFRCVLGNVMDGEFDVENVTMVKAELDDGQEIIAVNDIYAGMMTQVSARYELMIDGVSEWQSSNGVVVLSGAGSTGWYQSIMRNAYSLAGLLDDYNERDYTFSRESNYLRFVVRDPFVSKVSNADSVHGTISKTRPLKLVSHMPDGGVIFGDGVESDYISFPVGARVKLMPADEKLRLVRG